MTFIVERFTEIGTSGGMRLPAFSFDRLRTIIIPCDVETRVIAGRKDRIRYRGGEGRKER